MEKPKYNKSQTRFKQRIRISDKNLDWIRKNKTTKTYAGFLDIIINHYKKYANETVQPVSE